MRVLVLLLLCGGWMPAGAPEPDPAVLFSDAYNSWIQMRQGISDYVIPAPEVMEWQKVKSAWRRLEKVVEKEYRGER